MQKNVCHQGANKKNYNYHNDPQTQLPVYGYHGRPREAPASQ